MMHETNTYNNTGVTDGYTGTNTYHTPGTGAHHYVEQPGSVAETSAANSTTHGHQWQQNNAAERY
jgi:hypothetical protein